MHRMESIWGTDYLVFKLDRWLNNGEFMTDNLFKFFVLELRCRARDFPWEGDGFHSDEFHYGFDDT